MASEFTHRASLYDGLQALAKSSFPKRCIECGRDYQNVDAFIADTQRLKTGDSGLKPVEQEDGSQLVELFRDCPCGATLKDVFDNRRDTSPEGIKRRNKFGQLMLRVQEDYNVDKNSARKELLKIMDGRSSKIIKDILPSEFLAKPSEDKN